MSVPSHIIEKPNSSSSAYAPTAGLAAVGAQQGGEDPHDRGLAGSVGSEQPADRARRDLQVDTGQRLAVVVPLAKTLRPYGQRHGDSP
jgi:hypothetical protein